MEDYFQVEEWVAQVDGDAIWVIQYTKHILRLMTQILRPLYGKFAVVYFEDTLICSQNKASHMDYLRQLFEVLRSSRLYINKKKCSFL